jgi:hypothetical protein
MPPKENSDAKKKNNDVESSTMYWVLLVIILLLVIAALVVICIAYNNQTSWNGKVWGYFTNDAAIISTGTAATILWSSSSNTNTSGAGIYLDTSGDIYLTPGAYSLQYNIRLLRSPYNGTAISTLGILLNGVTIPSPYIESNEAIDTATTPTTQVVQTITGTAFVHITAASSKLNFTLTMPALGFTCPVATSPDANCVLFIQSVGSVPCC